MKHFPHCDYIVLSPISYENAFCQENIDYEKFYSEKAIIKGTMLGDKVQTV